MIKYWVVMCLVLLSGNVVLGQQLKSFSEDNMKFSEELEEFLTTSNRKDVKVIAETFKNHIEGGRFTDTQVSKIRGLCNLMLENKMRANPYFSGFIKSINAIIAKNLYESQLDNWLNIMSVYTENLKRSKLKNFVAYTSFGTDLFEKKALRFIIGQWLAMAHYKR